MVFSVFKNQNSNKITVISIIATNVIEISIFKSDAYTIAFINNKNMAHMLDINLRLLRFLSFIPTS